MENLKKKIKCKNGITLLALVITIVVLIILAGVTMNFIIGENGILKYVKFARMKYQNSAEKEANELSKIENYINKEDNISADMVSFTPEDTSWQVDNVKDALDYLFNN